ncbi:MAG: hypothetical protein SFZ02_12415 [bacterium]|nr:hypothetical protein [bacterium]
MGTYRITVLRFVLIGFSSDWSVRAGDGRSSLVPHIGWISGATRFLGDLGACATDIKCASTGTA